MRIEKIKALLVKGRITVEDLNSIVKKYLSELDKAKFEADIKAEYNSKYLVNVEYTELQQDDEGNEVEVTKTKQEYDLTAPTFEQYKNEVVVVTEAVEEVLDEDGMVVTPAVAEVSELVRPYIPVEITDEMVQAELDKLPEYKEYKDRIKDEKLSTYITEVNGKKFYADTISRLDIASALALVQSTGKTSTVWKLAEEYNGSRFVEVTVEELSLVLKQSLEYKAEQIGICC
jgi:hypothetical protein